jgi:hypothetical protein
MRHAFHAEIGIRAAWRTSRSAASSLRETEKLSTSWAHVVETISWRTRKFMS